VFYFTDAPMLARGLVTLDAPPVAYATIAILAATTFVLGGFMREQVCIYMCPWPRIQAAMMDDNTLTVAYRDWRGEPRGKGRLRRQAATVEDSAPVTRAAGPKQGGRSPMVPMPGLPSGLGTVRQDEGALGDCIDCNACVNVCPMGIDIRDGQQLACITCALCIDACDDVMAKIGQPRGLIDYLALSDAPLEREGAAPIPVWKHVLRARNIVYAMLWAAIGLGLVFALFLRPQIELTVAPIRNPTFVTLADGTIRNVYDVRLRNKQGVQGSFTLSLDGTESFVLSVEGAEGTTVEVPPDTQSQTRVYIAARPDSPAAAADRTDVRIWVEDAATGERASVDTSFNGRGAE
jgi:polyferredoxin